MVISNTINSIIFVAIIGVLNLTANRNLEVIAELQISEACEYNKLARFSKDNNEYRAVQIDANANDASF